MSERKGGDTMTMPNPLRPIGRSWRRFRRRPRAMQIRTMLIVLAVVVVLIAYFYYCGTVEERNLVSTFPAAYPEYRRRTKMLIPFLL